MRLRITSAMTVLRPAVVVLYACFIAGCISAESRATEPGPTETAAAFLKAYAAGDKAGVMSLLIADEIHAYGSDVSEIVVGRAALERMFDNDMKLWRGSAKFGAMTHVSSESSGNLATLFFDVPFTVGNRPELTVRFATVWKRSDGGWKLIQSSNVVPTVGQSAADLLRATAPPSH